MFGAFEECCCAGYCQLEAVDSTGLSWKAIVDVASSLKDPCR